METVETGNKPRVLCKESLGKIKSRAFPKCVGPQILPLQCVDYFGTSEHLNKDVISMELRPLNFRVFIHVYSL